MLSPAVSTHIQRLSTCWDSSLYESRTVNFSPEIAITHKLLCLEKNLGTIEIIRNKFMYERT